MECLLKLLNNEVTASYFQGLATLIAVYLAYRYAIRQMRTQTQIQITQDHNQRHADALQSAWHLLQYMSPTKNQLAILHFERSGKGKTAQDQYFIELANAQRFIHEALPHVFYQQHSGLYWSAALKEIVFEYRSILYGFCLKENTNTAERVLIENTELVGKLKTSYEQMHQLLKTEISILYKNNAIHP